MDIRLLKSILMWSAAINYGVLIFWFLSLTTCRERFYSLQTRWFPMSRESLVACNYMMYGLYKLFIFLFNLVPLIVLSFLT